MPRLARIRSLDHLGGLALRVSFDDGLVRELDLDEVLHGGVFDALREPALFSQAHIDHIAGTVAWPNGADLDPDVLHGGYEPATGAGPKVLAECRLAPAG